MIPPRWNLNAIEKATTGAARAAVIGQGERTMASTLYMSMANLGHSAGSKIFGSLSQYTSFVQNYALMGTIAVTMFCKIAIFRKHPTPVPADAMEPPGRRP
jgi:predicted MFS family arabinose efflux permease